MVNIPESLFEQYYQVVDSLYDNDHIADETKLININKVECPNCLPGSMSIYRNGGPIPFTIGICPYCSGQSYLEEEIISYVRLRVYSDKRKWLKIGNLEIPDGSVQILAKMSDFTAIKQADYLLFYPESDWKYKLNSDPFPYGFGKRNFAAYCIKI